MDADRLVRIGDEVVAEIAAVLACTHDWALSGERNGQYRVDVAVNDAALAVLRSYPVGILSEESGLENADADVVVVLDPLDGSTNASRGVAWYATSVCAVDRHGPAVAVVADQSGGDVYRARRGGGATINGEPLVRRDGAIEWAEALVGVSGLAPHHLGWGQFRAFGAAALDLCLVASGVLDAFIDCSHDAHGVWDYAGGALVCREMGVDVVDAAGRDLYVLDPTVRRTPVAAPSRLLDLAVAARRSF